MFTLRLFTSDTSVNGGYGCNHKDCDDGEYIYNGDIIDWHKAYRIVAIRLTKRNIKCNRRLAKKFLKKARFILNKNREVLELNSKEMPCFNMPFGLYGR